MMPSGVKVYLASQPVDFRKGPDSLLSLVTCRSFPRPTRSTAGECQVFCVT